MTRKQALNQAIRALSALEGQEETISLLQDIYEEIPLTHWSDKSIRDTVEQFIVDNGRIPTASDFRKKGMPPHPVFSQKYKMTLSEWLQKNYPTPQPDKKELKDKYTQEFIDEYLRIRPKSADDFNKQRNPKTKTWNTVANYHNVKSWCSLIKTLALPAYSNISKLKGRMVFEVSVTTDCDFFNDYIKKHSS